MSNTACDSGLGLIRIITTDKPRQGPFIPCANLATAQLYASDSTRIGKDAFEAAFVKEWDGNAPFYVVERIAPGLTGGKSVARELSPETVLDDDIDGLIERIADALEVN